MFFHLIIRILPKLSLESLEKAFTVSAQIEGRPSINFSRFKTAALFEFGQSAGLIKLPLYWLAALGIIIFISY